MPMTLKEGGRHVNPVSTGVVTLTIYSHVTPSLQAEAAEQVASLMPGLARELL